MSSRSDIYSRCLFCFMLYWWTWLTEKFCTYPASGFRCFRSWLGWKLDKNGGCLFSLWKNVSNEFFILVYMSFICILLFKMLIVGKYLVTNCIPAILCFISVIWNVCLNGLAKSYYVPLFEWEQGIIGFFQN